LIKSCYSYKEVPLWRFIGCGAIANNAHIPAYRKNENAVIKYFCDILPERAEAAVEKYQCGKAITDY